MQSILISNNQLCKKKYKDQIRFEFIDGTMKDVLLTVRDYIHKGHLLLSHPLSGSVKPGENPYKSVLVSLNPQSGLDFDSLSIIENAIITADKFLLKFKTLSPQMQADFESVDLSLITSAFANQH